MTESLHSDLTHAVVDYNLHASRLVHTTLKAAVGRARTDTDSTYTIAPGYVPETDHDCIIIARTGDMFDTPLAIAEMESEDEGGSHVRLGIEPVLGRDPILLRQVVHETILKMEDEHMLPTGLARQKATFTIESDPEQTSDIINAMSALAVDGWIEFEPAPVHMEQPEQHLALAA